MSENEVTRAPSPGGKVRRLLMSGPSAGLALFLATFGVCAVSLATRRQLGLADQWFALGINIAAHGVLGEGTEPTVFKPPGYPAFVAGVVRVAVGPPPPAHQAHSFPRNHELATLTAPYDPAYLERAARAVYWAQALLLAASAVLIYWWIGTLVRNEIAFVAALLFGINPYCVILVGLLHYGILHMFLLIAACGALERAIDRRGGRALVACGVLWGAATLVRPVTLILPPFLLCALLLRSVPNAREGLRSAALVIGGMSMVLLSYTARNYAVAGQVVPVSAQTWTNIWASTAVVVEPQPNHYRWKAIREPLRRVLRRTVSHIPGQPSSPDTLPMAENLRLESTMKDIALKNLRYRPEVYLENCVRTFYSFNVHISAVLIKVYQYVQEPGFRPKAWYWPGEEQDFHPSTETAAFTRFVDVLTLLSAVGLVRAAYCRDRSLLIASAVYLCLAVAHSITWLDLWYYYVKLPFLFVFAFYFVERAQRWSQSHGGRWPLAAVLCGAMTLFCVSLAVRVIWLS